MRTCFFLATLETHRRDTHTHNPHATHTRVRVKHTHTHTHPHTQVVQQLPDEPGNVYVLSKDRITAGGSCAMPLIALRRSFSS